MSDGTVTGTREIVVDEVFPHAPQAIWRTLTDGELMLRWLRMPMVGFAPSVGTCFTYQTEPAGAWDGSIRCEVLEVTPNERLVYSWRSGDAGNVGYGAPLDTIVTFTLTPVAGGTRLRLVHSGFVVPRNATALENMGDGWPKVVDEIGTISGED